MILMHAMIAFWAGFCCSNMVIWKEIQHDNDDAFAERNAGCIAALRDCGLLKFFRTPSMVSHERLLEHILRMWNLEKHSFEFGAHILTVEVEDIYFLTGLTFRQSTGKITHELGKNQGFF